MHTKLNTHWNHLELKIYCEKIKYYTSLPAIFLVHNISFHTHTHLHPCLISNYLWIFFVCWKKNTNIHTKMALDFVATYKVLVLGDSNVGKTCIVHRYCDEKYYDTYISTIGKWRSSCFWFRLSLHKSIINFASTPFIFYDINN